MSVSSGSLGCFHLWMDFDVKQHFPHDRKDGCWQLDLRAHLLIQKENLQEFRVHVSQAPESLYRGISEFIY